MRDERTGQVDEGKMVGRLALVPDEERPEAVVPAVRPFDYPATGLLSADGSGEGRLAAAANVSPNATFAEVAFRLGIVVPLVEAQVLRAPWTSWRAEHHRVERLAHHVQIGDVRGRQGDRQRDPAAVGQNMALGTEFSAVTGTRTRVLPPFGAFTMTPSREHQARSAPTVP